MRSEKLIDEQAAELTQLFPTLLRTLFTMDDADESVHLPISQLRVCGALYESPKTITSIAQELGISTSAATQLANRLQRAKITERLPEETDRRIRTLRLTEYGRSIMRTRYERRTAQVRAALGKISPDERKSIINSMQTLLNAANGV